MQINKIVCPNCGISLQLKPKPDNPYRLQGWHDCVGGVNRCVIEIDAPDFPPPDLHSRLEPSEPPAPFNKSKKDRR